MTVAGLESEARAHDGDTWVYASKSEPRGIGQLSSPSAPYQKSVLQRDADGVQPLSYQADDGNRLDQARRTTCSLIGSTVGSRASTRDARSTCRCTPGIQDDLSVQIALMVELLAGPHARAVLS